MELSARVAVVGPIEAGGALARRGATSLGDAEAPGFSIALLHRRGFAWN